MVSNDQRHQRTQMFDLGQNRIDTGRLLDRQYDRDWLEGDVNLDVLFLFIVEKVELRWLQAVHDVAGPVGHKRRSHDVRDRALYDSFADFRDFGIGSWRGLRRGSHAQKNG